MRMPPYHRTLATTIKKDRDMPLGYMKTAIVIIQSIPKSQNNPPPLLPPKKEQKQNLISVMMIALIMLTMAV